MFILRVDTSYKLCLCSGEACGAVILERQVQLSRSYANVVGWATSSTSTLLPSGFVDPGAIQKAAEDAVMVAHVAIHDIGFTHLHAMGNSIGDGPEVLGVAEALATDRHPEKKLVLANHKANFGHSQYASGLTALFTSIVSLQQRCVPVHLKVTSAIEEIKNSAELILPTKVPALLSEQDKNHASISGTSFSGNAA